MSLLQQVQASIETHHLLLPGDLVIVGVSGGADSVCLAHVLRALADTFHVRLHLAHLHHGIRGAEADEDARFVAALGANWGVPCTVERADVPALAQARGMAIEEAARQARYAFLAALARRLDGRSVAVAHNADDQVETVLMHLLRGSGLAGLRGMRPLAWVDEPSPPAPLPILGEGSLTSAPAAPPSPGEGSLTSLPASRPALGEGSLTSLPASRPALGEGGLTSVPVSRPALGEGGLALAPAPRLILGEGSLSTDPPGAERIRLLRPLLAVPRGEIEAYNRAHGLESRFDCSNLEQTYYRNRLRHELLPFLETYNPNIREVVRRTAEAIAGDYDLLRAQLAETWPRVVQRGSDSREAGGEAVVLDRAAFRGLPVGLQRAVLREGIHRMRRSLRNINWVHVDDALRVAVHAEVGRQATLPQGLVLTVGYTQITLAEEGYRPPGEDRPHMAGNSLPVPVPGEVRLPGGDWVLTTAVVAREALPADWAGNPDRFTAYLDVRDVGGGNASAALWVRTRREGDWFCPLGLGQHRQKLRDFYVNTKVTQAERASAPLLVWGDEIAWVVGRRVDTRFAVQQDTQQVLVVKVRRDA